MNNSSRRLKHDVEEFIGQLFLWSLVVVAFVFLQSLFSSFLHPVIYIPICVVFAVPIGFSCVIFTVAALNFLQKLLKRKCRDKH